MLKIIIMHCGVHRITINHHKFTEYVHRQLYSWNFQSINVFSPLKDTWTYWTVLFNLNINGRRAAWPVWSSIPRLTRWSFSQWFIQLRFIHSISESMNLNAVLLPMLEVLVYPKSSRILLHFWDTRNWCSPLLDFRLKGILHTFLFVGLHFSLKLEVSLCSTVSFSDITISLGENVLSQCTNG